MTPQVSRVWPDLPHRHLFSFDMAMMSSEEYIVVDEEDLEEEGVPEEEVFAGALAAAAARGGTGLESRCFADVFRIEEGLKE